MPLNSLCRFYQRAFALDLLLLDQPGIEFSELCPLRQRLFIFEAEAFSSIALANPSVTQRHAPYLSMAPRVLSSTVDSTTTRPSRQRPVVPVIPVVPRNRKSNKVKDQKDIVLQAASGHEENQDEATRSVENSKKGIGSELSETRVHVDVGTIANKLASSDVPSSLLEVKSATPASGMSERHTSEVSSLTWM